LSITESYPEFRKGTYSIPGVGTAKFGDGALTRDVNLFSDFDYLELTEFDDKFTAEGLLEACDLPQNQYSFEKTAPTTVIVKAIPDLETTEAMEQEKVDFLTDAYYKTSLGAVRAEVFPKAGSLDRGYIRMLLGARG
jgi:hypothetical protein